MTSWREVNAPLFVWVMGCEEVLIPVSQHIGSSQSPCNSGLFIPSRGQVWTSAATLLVIALKLKWKNMGQSRWRREQKCVSTILSHIICIDVPCSAWNLGLLLVRCHSHKEGPDWTINHMQVSLSLYLNLHLDSSQYDEKI